MRYFISFVILLGCSAVSFGQQRYILYFKDKVPVSNIEEYFSKAAVEKKQKRKIPFSLTDHPVSQQYLNKISSEGIRIVLASRWLNAALVETAGQYDFRSFSFVAQAEPVFGKPGQPATAGLQLVRVDSSERNFSLHHGRALYDHGLKAQGMHIAVFDGGFQGVDQNAGFRKLRNEGRILYTRDIVGGQSVYTYDQHGTLVLSTMAGYKEGSFIGTATEASYSLFVTENVFSESKAEEFNWVVAAEIADSLGVDVINSSLSYTQFDDTTTNYQQSDLDGKTTIVARGATMAANKGMLVVSSAGNARQQPWGSLGSPGDADSILTVGAVDIMGQVAPYSSPGPTADGRVKPEVCALGFQTALIDRDGNILLGNGTSFSAPCHGGTCGLIVAGSSRVQ